jgi:hypothetical protein
MVRFKGSVCLDLHPSLRPFVCMFTYVCTASCVKMCFNVS